MKKILFLTPYVPSNRAGGENFTRLLLEQLSRNNKIDLLYYRYVDDPQYVCQNDNVRVIKEVINSTFVKIKNAVRHPFTHPIFTIRLDKKIFSYLKQMEKENHYDLLYLDHSQMAIYGKYFPQKKKIFMSHDVMLQRYSRKGGFINRKLVAAKEKELMRLPNMDVFTFSDKDKDIVHSVYGVDAMVTNFFLDKDVIEAQPTNIKQNIIFFGKWKRPDNFEGLKWFFEKVYKRLNHSIHISIIGKWLPIEFEDFLQTKENVEYLGFTKNPYGLIANSMVTVSPLFSGAGVKVKVVESLACGTPVIGSDIAFEGISDIYSQFMIKAETPEEYANAINNLSITIEERTIFKQKFLENYIGQSIVTYIENL